MRAIVGVYAKLIQKGIKTLEDVPEIDREDVTTVLAETTKTEVTSNQ